MKTEYAIKLYGNKILNEKYMCKVLQMSLPETGREISVKSLCRLRDVVDGRYDAYMSKRYDLVDIRNRRIYEFDGEQHFRFIPHFHQTYEHFIKNRVVDIEKQRIAIELGYDIVRISGELTVSEFIDILDHHQLQKGQSLFIRDTVSQRVNTKDLKVDNDLSDSLLVDNLELRKEVLRLKQEIDELQKNKVISSCNDTHLDSTYLFLRDTKFEYDGIKIISIYHLYNRYLKWCQETNRKQYIKNQSKFTKEITRHMKSELNMSRVDQTIRFGPSKNQSVSYMLEYVVSLSDSKLNCTSKYFERYDDYITSQDVDEVADKLNNREITLDNINECTDRELICVYHLKNTDHAIAKKLLK